jgi:SulP family sulfate permease
LFFGTIANVEDTIRALVAPAAWVRRPLRFLVLDLALVPGVDMSAAEALVRVQRVLASRGVGLCIAGVYDMGISRALASVGLYEAPGVERFETVNEALECAYNHKAGVLPLTCQQGQKTRTFARGSCRKNRRRLKL